MRKSLLVLSSLLYCFMTASAQDDFSYKVIRNGISPLSSVQSFADSIGAEYLPGIQPVQRPRPGTDLEFRRVKDSVDRLRAAFHKPLYKTGKTDPASITPLNDSGFSGHVTNGIPNDNNLAISNGGAIISVMNTNITAYNENGDTLFKPKSLAFFAKALGPLIRTYDPKVVYDPEADRFIVVFLNGAESKDTRVIVAFSTTNDPRDPWNFYTLPGNYLNDTSWFDYPIIGINKQDLFITGNLLKDNTFWKDGFKQSIIWQLDKWKGYNGQPMEHNFYHDIRYKGKAIWSICAIPGGLDLTNNEMYFMSVRPSAFAGDTVFLHHLKGRATDKNSNISYKIFISEKYYGVPPSAPEPGNRNLETNDCRVLSGFIQDNVIQYVQSTLDHSKISSGVFHGIISNLSGTKVKIRSHIISSDSLDFAYPSIAYAGKSRNDQSSMITFSHVSKTTFPGTSAAMYYGDGTYSNVLRVKEGLGNIRWGTDTAVRWGDYTAIQRKYNDPSIFWLSGSYGGTNGESKTWIAAVKNSSSPYVVEQIGNFYPNPAASSFNAEFHMPDKGDVNVSIFDMTGRKVLDYNFNAVNQGRNLFMINIDPLAVGVYVVQIRDQNSNKLYEGKLIRSL